MLYYQNGNLLTSDCNIIIHQANCFNVMGGGIALQIKNMFPNAYEVDTKSPWSPEEKLGNFTIGVHQNNLETKYIYNVYGQFDLGRQKRATDYEALYSGLDKALQDIKLKYPHAKVGLPYNMGCGLGGGSWPIVESMLKHLSNLYDIPLYIYEL